jgi:hypothetical protein
MRVFKSTMVGLWVAAALSGCGSRTPDHEQIRQLISNFGEALAEGRTDRSCRLLTREAQRDLVRQNEDVVGRGSCAQTVRKVLALATAAQRKELRAIRAETVTVRGDRAVAILGRLTALEYAGATHLEKREGRWLIGVAPA